MKNRRLVELLRERLKRKAKHNLLDFIIYNDLDYEVNWHHKYIADKIQDFIEGDKKRLMIFVPPQHGKSQITSRMLPAYLFGINPDLKIAGISYGIDLARSFNRDIQRIMNDQYYKNIFPNTKLNEKRTVTTENYLKNSNEFEIIGNKGSYKAVGILGGLSGRKVDVAIIDDPVKDAMEANSQTYRDRVWEWYLNVLTARLHNESKVLLIMTRWHEDDLAGRLLENQKDKWEVIKIPAICEEKQPFDPREIGDALWETRHSLEDLLDLKQLSERTFANLYQQRPAPVEGGILKKKWFPIIEISDVPKYIIKDMLMDTAYTEKAYNDPTGFLVVGNDKVNNRMIIFDFKSERLTMPNLLKRFPVIRQMNNIIRGMTYVEPKASGLSFIQLIQAQTMINITKIESDLIKADKMGRANFAAPFAESGRIVLVRGNWNESFTTELANFPSAPHDEAIDLLGYACDKYFISKKRKGVKRKN